MARMTSIQILLSLAANLNWTLNQLEVKNGFLRGDLEDAVYMDVPPSLEVSQLKGRCIDWRNHCTNWNNHLEIV